jgi:hypothetical protein
MPVGNLVDFVLDRRSLPLAAERVATGLKCRLSLDWNRVAAEKMAIELNYRLSLDWDPNAAVKRVVAAAAAAKRHFAEWKLPILDLQNRRHGSRRCSCQRDWRLHDPPDCHFRPIQCQRKYHLHQADQSPSVHSR